MSRLAFREEIMNMIEIRDTGVIFQNPLPGVQPLQARMPGLCKLSEKEIMCVYMRGSAPLSLDSVYGVARSRDGGKSWYDEGVLWNRKNDHRAYSYGYGYPIRMADGEILFPGYRWDRSNSDSDFNVYNPKTLGAVPLDALLFRSRDGGRTWTAPQIIPPPDGITMANPTGRVLVLKNGDLLLPMETWKAWSDTGPIRQQSLIMFSSDGGKSWNRHVTVAMDPKHRILYWNGMFSRLESGRILVMYWTKDSKTENDLTIQATYSEDEGATWAPLYDTGIIGQMGCTIDVGKGRVLAVYNRRDEEKPGIWMVISKDGGKRWPRAGHTLLWDARGRNILGSTDETNRSRSIYDEGLMAFGKPDVVHIAGNIFFAGFWCTSNFVMHLRYARLVIT